MMIRRVKGLLVAAFSAFCLSLSVNAEAQHEEHGEVTVHTDAGENQDIAEKPQFDANEVIFGHVQDAHQYHFFSYTGSDGHEHHVGIPLPVIVYQQGRGLSVFSSSRFHHGEHPYMGYQLVTPEYKEHLAKFYSPQDLNNFRNESIIAVDEAGMPVPGAQVLDLSMTRNVVQMLLALTVLLVIMLSVAKKYRQGQGVTTAPRGLQGAIEPVITFIRDEVAKPNIGHNYKKFLPLLLTIFFFILINNIFGLIPGSANVTGNIAFTAVLGVITALVVNFSGNKHYWGHIFNPPVPFGVKFIMVPVEILSIFTKPFALIIRLFANMLAGHIIIICLISLIFIFGGLSKVAGWGFAPISIGFSVFIYVIEVLVAFIQAFIFTNLTAVFIGQSNEEGHDVHHEENEAPARPVII